MFQNKLYAYIAQNIRKGKKGKKDKKYHAIPLIDPISIFLSITFIHFHLI